MKTLVMKYIGQLVAAGHAEWEMHEALGFFMPAAGHRKLPDLKARSGVCRST
jgi:hypothetical protein